MANGDRQEIAVCRSKIDSLEATVDKMDSDIRGLSSAATMASQAISDVRELGSEVREVAKASARMEGAVSGLTMAVNEEIRPGIKALPDQISGAVSQHFEEHHKGGNVDGGGIVIPKSVIVGAGAIGIVIGACVCVMIWVFIVKGGDVSKIFGKAVPAQTQSETKKITTPSPL